MSKPPKHILVIRLSAMGDVAMTVPVLRVLLESYPEVKITILTRPFFTPFFRDLKRVEVFPVDVKGKHKGVFGLFKLAKALNKEKFYVVADLHNVLRSNILKKFLNCRRFVTIDKGRKEKRLLTRARIFKPLKTTHQRYADVFRAMGYELDLSKPTFPHKANLEIKTSQIIGNYNKLVGIAPFAAHKSKMYPLDLMEEVIQELSKDYKIVLFGGGEKEVKILSQWALNNPNVINLAGELSLNEEIDVISNLDVMLSMDSGNAHIAAMLGIKVVTIWGVTHPYAGFAPFNQPEDYALLADRIQYPHIPTSIYGNKYPLRYEQAAGSISTKDVIEKVRSIIPLQTGIHI